MIFASSLRVFPCSFGRAAGREQISCRVTLRTEMGGDTSTTPALPRFTNEKDVKGLIATHRTRAQDDGYLRSLQLINTCTVAQTEKTDSERSTSSA